MSLTKIKSRGKVYYQIRDKQGKVIKHLGTEEQILKVFQYKEENSEPLVNTEKPFY